jgi:RNA polymerase sigma-70 factor (ECF subfamily)
VSKLLGPGRGVAMGAGELPLEAEALAGPAADRELVAQCRRGDEEAFARLVALHEGMVFSLSARLLGSAEEAHDVAQEVFLLVYRRLGRFEGRSSLRTWIYRIVVNQCHNRRRFWHRRQRHKEAPIDEGLATVPAPGSWPVLSGSNPYEEARRRERARRVQQALLELSFEHRAVLLLREVEGLSGEETSAALGIAEGTVKSRLSRAREALRQKLAGMLGEGDLP